MTITQTGQAELGSVLMGAGTNYLWRDVPRGLSSEDVQGSDHQPVGVDGFTASRDWRPKRTIVVELWLTGDDVNQRVSRLDTLQAAWSPTSSDTTLTVRLDGWGGDHLGTFYGRPRGVKWDPEMIRFRQRIPVDCTFECTDPNRYGTAVTVSASASIVVNNSGNVASPRCTLAVTGNGGTPIVTNTTDPDVGTVAFRTTTASVVTLNLKTQAVTVSGANRADLVSPACLWFAIAAGNNTITATSCSSVAVTSFQPAWL